MPLPMPPMMSGSRFAPKISTTIPRMTMSPGRPMRPMIALLGRSLYHQLQGPPGEFPVSRGEETTPQTQVRQSACHEIRENAADRAALTQRRDEQGGKLR